MDNLNVLYIGPPGTGKTYTAKKEAHEFCGSKERYRFVSFCPSMSYSDFITGVSAGTLNGKVLFEKELKVFAEFCKIAEDAPNEKYAIVLDDIDRADVAAVFGEAMSAIENRGIPVTLSDGGQLIVPPNLKILAAMSSVSKNGTDYALFGRFDIRPLTGNVKELWTAAICESAVNGKNMKIMECIHLSIFHTLCLKFVKK